MAPIFYGPAGVALNSTPSALTEPQQATAHIAVQQVAYQTSQTIFSFSDAFAVDGALLEWAAKDLKNNHGSITQVISQQTAVGAASSLIGYIRNSKAVTSVLAPSASFVQMAPVLRQVDVSNVVFYVPALSYDFDKGSLVADFASAIDTARHLGYHTLVAKDNGADAQEVAAAARGLADASAAPVVVVYDGLHGINHSSWADLKKVQVPTFKAAKLSDMLRSKELTPYSYSGSAEPDSVTVALAGQAAGDVLDIRLASPILPDTLIGALPATTTEIKVVGHQLYRDVLSAVRLHYGIGNGPRIVETELSLPPISHKSLLLWDSDKSSTSVNSASALVRAATYVGETLDVNTIYDNQQDGGAVEYQFAFDLKQPFSYVERSRLLVVNKLSALRSFDVAARAEAGADLVVAATVEEITALPDSIKKELANKQLSVYSFDLSKVDSAATEGRTNLFALQAAIWQLFDPTLSVDDVTSRIVHSNTQDTELLGSTISSLIRELNEKGLIKVETAEWAKIELDPSKAVPELTAYAKPTSLEPSEAMDLEEFVAAETLTRVELSKRFAFAEAYGQSQDLRPEIATKNFIAKVKVNQRVTPDDYDRHIFHLELDITGTGLKYSIGEALGIHAPNNINDVKEFIKWYKLNPDEVVSVPNRDNTDVHESKTVYHALRDNLDLFGKVPKRFYESLAPYAEDSKQKAHLEKLATPEGAAELKKRTDEDFDNYFDILKEFDSAHPPISKLVDMISPLKRREYSIASSQKVHPNAVHLLIVVVDWVNKDGVKKYGQCSKFLADLHTGQEVTVSVKPSVMKLPKDPKTPVIMAGLGTGLAPFKAFLEEKLWQKENGAEIGEIYLFLGSRHQRQEYLYGELFEAFKNAGVLTHIGAAFSRDQKEKIYIQHRINEAKPQLIDAFVKKGGNFYLCGPTWPVPDISASLSSIVATEAAERGEKVDEDRVIEDLKDKERYILEVY